MADFATYDGPGGVVGAVVRELGERLEAAVAAGVEPDRVVLDPGLGFAKRGEHNWELLAHLDAVAALGRPLLVGASRKSFLGTLLAGPDGTSRPPGEREHAHAALVPLVADQGAWGLRVHDVRATHDALAAWQALRSRQSPPQPYPDQPVEGARR
jgi:dihydropteroate synthase